MPKSRLSQWSRVDPLLWNLMYYGVLASRVPEKAKFVAFADDLALFVTEKSSEDVDVHASLV